MVGGRSVVLAGGRDDGGDFRHFRLERLNKRAEPFFIFRIGIEKKLVGAVDLFLPGVGICGGIERGGGGGFVHREMAVMKGNHMHDAEHFQEAAVFVRDVDEAEPAVLPFHRGRQADERAHEGRVHAVALGKVDDEVEESGPQFRFHQGLKGGGEKHVAKTDDLDKDRVLGPGYSQSSAGSGLWIRASHLPHPFFRLKIGIQSFIHIVSSWGRAVVGWRTLVRVPSWAAAGFPVENPGPNPIRGSGRSRRKRRVGNRMKRYFLGAVHHDASNGCAMTDNL